ncbi:MAG: DUF4954 family protein, partial [bacterium]
MDSQKYFPIENNDIQILESNGCLADNWSSILVSEEFDPTRVRDVIFEGEVKIGSLKGKIERSDGFTGKAGIFKATLNNVYIEDNCYISNVLIGLYNLKIESGVIIENVGRIACIGETSFGNGHEISVLNEAGGRELKITKETSAQVAYLSVLYRDNKGLIENLDRMVDQYSVNIKN